MENRRTTPEEIKQMQQELRCEKQKRDGKAKTSKGKTTGRILFAFLVLLLLGALVSIQLQRNQGEIPSLLGFQLYRVESGSMEPTLPVGSVFLSRKADGTEALKEGDIVTFHTLSGSVVTHRIIEVVRENDQTSYRTKGDNPVNSPDSELLTSDRVLSVFVAKIPLT